MKKLILLLMILPLALTTVNAQDSLNSKSVRSLESFYPQEGDVGITVNVNGLISNISATPRQDLRGANTLLIRYNLKNNLTARLGLAPSVMSYRELSTDSVGKDLVQFDSTARRSSVSIRPGLELHLKGTRRLDPYIAMDVEMGIVGKFSAGSVTTVTDTTGAAKFTRTITEDGGFALGAKLSAGMNYFVAKKLAFGLEYGMGVSSVTSGGDRQDVLQIEPVSGTPSTVSNRSSTRVRDLNLFVDPTVQITISYFFSL